MVVLWCLLATTSAKVAGRRWMSTSVNRVLGFVPAGSQLSTERTGMNILEQYSPLRISYLLHLNDPYDTSCATVDMIDETSCSMHTATRCFASNRPQRPRTAPRGGAPKTNKAPLPEIIYREGAAKRVIIAGGKARLFKDGNPLVYGGAVAEVRLRPLDPLPHT